jgi:hypothetical protein
MKIDAAKSKIIKQAVVNVYKDVTSINSDTFVQGKTAVIKQVFVRIAEGMEAREESDFDDVLIVFKSYVAWRMKSWWNWENATNENLMPILNNKENINIFLAKLAAPPVQPPSNYKKPATTAGAGSADQWDF